MSGSNVRQHIYVVILDIADIPNNFAKEISYLEPYIP